VHGLKCGLRKDQHSDTERDGRSPLNTPLFADFQMRFEKFSDELVKLGGEAYVFSDYQGISDFLLEHITDDAGVFLYDEIREKYDRALSELKSTRAYKLSTDFENGYDKRDVAAFGSAILPCAACIAETGTIVLRNNMRLPAALATRLFVITEPARLIASLDELFTEKFRDAGGSNLFLVTGPSRTADIEKELVTGVHGPKEVYVIFHKE
ncbi:MAG: lactate utilization protein, partial [Bacteroidetes bacterium]|nr:lactate utilization protein [Bacteroidota bacterium]